MLWESTSEMGDPGWQLEGWTGNYLRVQATAASARWNDIDPVRLNELNGEGLKGVIPDSG